MPHYPVFNPKTRSWAVWSTIVDDWIATCLPEEEVVRRYPWVTETSPGVPSALETAKKWPEAWTEYYTGQLVAPPCPGQQISFTAEELKEMARRRREGERAVRERAEKERAAAELKSSGL